ncbi:SpoIIE family protein phosphatase [Staphylococcus coagulans]|uniref:SpoIIE family protein phosphatase n=1 Tax=Staphylococcus coagulans TaxID=74706 RepID=UPI0015F8B4A1|nr:PP2C family protein-serine/threonine phosphatase [Staphylococcus coagulans]MBA8765037.1 SpoIIE family protein phosphatase [Staphylococcus coagulans]MBT2810792.1 PP2C family protein-serine/threonine phosphatase [Staphylococcus coagulans]MBT2812996.1 PP2C family protein-serine/threonine phosphatase [Staphylococcus coagulans]MBT2819973.1 PP2C family protein-serine/threonine phosphatase [Staphylococcus coagulans]MBT2822206.1 PP2C family protein-serine/threonine phosphatase [Staphylococcus coagu
MSEDSKLRYFELVRQFLKHDNREKILKQAQSFSKDLSDDALLPEDFVCIHKQFFKNNSLNQSEMIESLDVLKTVVESFGYDYQDYKNLVNKVEVHDKELDVASRLQQTMLKTNIPQFDSIQIGVISVAAQHVSGDYFNLIDHKDGTMSFAVADVIGKGIPAALAMSMIKFGMDSYGHSQLPNDGLKRLNRVVEKNINQNMFVTMFYGLYEDLNHVLYCSSAGHEPGYIFRAKTNEFEEITVRGRVLGVSPHVRYQQQEIAIEIDDMIIVFTDGVTEMRKEDGHFINTQNILDFILKYKSLHPQDIVQLLYEELLRVQKSGKRDDLTILIIKRVH